ncbi:unnamed protein product [Miscanthus lutarioriparius]|uniref:Brix domain-containing protein n=1 Tax=Miscanthus lutarioriparius TaxID=422564 RepID=A0A811PMG7_9POAL|nr:unnamed protein product [Miscanthus lutarioriparius]
MIRRRIRERHQYLYSKSVEASQRALFEKKRRIRAALEEGNPIPTELRNEEHELRRQIDLEDQEPRGPNGALHSANRRDLVIFLGAEGRLSHVTENEPWRPDLILVHEHRGKPDGLIVSHLPNGPTAYFGLLNVVTRHDIKGRKAMGKMSEAYPHLVLDNFSTQIGERTATILKHLFPMPKPDSKRIITFANRDEYISFRHHVYEKPGGPRSMDLKEVGPRFEMRLYQIKLGTVE